jgi:hypothetical protein
VQLAAALGCGKCSCAVAEANAQLIAANPTAAHLAVTEVIDAFDMIATRKLEPETTEAQASTLCQINTEGRPQLLPTAGGKLGTVCDGGHLDIGHMLNVVMALLVQIEK